MIKLLKNFKPYIWLLLILVVLVYVQVMTTLKLPEYMAKIVNQGIVGEDNTFILHTG